MTCIYLSKQPAMNQNQQVEETHNYCTKEKCVCRSKNQTTLVADEDILPCLANFCLGCGVNLGDCNPRQYCCKLYCPYENADDNVEENIDDNIP
jgi:hypothetical protein